MREDPQHPGRGDDVLDLVPLVATIWRRRWLILAGTAVAAILAVLVVQFVPNPYRARGTCWVGPEKGLPASRYQMAAPRIVEPDRFLERVRQEGTFTEAELKTMAGHFPTGGSLQPWLVPGWVHNGAVNPRAPKEAAVTTLDLSFEAENPDLATRGIVGWAGFIRDQLLYASLARYVAEGDSTSRLDQQNTERALADNRIQSEQLARKVPETRAILARYPALPRMDERQREALSDVLRRYYAVVTWLVSAEKKALDLREQGLQLRRNREMGATRSAFFEAAKAAVAAAGGRGEPLLRELRAIRNRLEGELDPSRDPAREVCREIEAELLRFQRDFTIRFRFLAGPRITHWSQRGGIVLAVTLLVLALGVALALLLEWWRQNRDRVTATRVE